MTSRGYAVELSWLPADLSMTAAPWPSRARPGLTGLPDAADPAAASRAIAVAYTHIPGSAGSVDIHVGLFRKKTNAWRLVRKIDGLYGMGVENPVFSGQTFEVTTNMLGPDDPRCCPTLKVRWRIDLDTGGVTRLN